MKLALVTGASSGIGAATARALAAQGYRVVLTARRREALEAVAGQLGDAAVVEPCDAGDGDAVLKMAARVRREHGAPDVIVNSAGAGQWKRIEDTSPDEAQGMMAAPYFAAFNVTHAFMADMLARGAGVVIHVGSPVSIMTWPHCPGYAAARWALRGLHEALCDDLAGTGVHSCHVVFGKVSTGYFDANPDSEDKIPGIGSLIRTSTPEQCARVILRTIARPRRQVLYPLMLRVFAWVYALLPWPTRWLVRRTGARRQLSPPGRGKPPG